MPWPKGVSHPNWNTSKDIMKNGGYLGRHEDTYTDEELHELGSGLIEWLQETKNIYMKYFFAKKGILWPRVSKLEARAPFFKEYIDIARQIQESRLVSEPMFKDNNMDSNHARFVLARHHRGEFQDEKLIVASDHEIAKLEQSLNILDYMQGKKNET